MCKKFSGEMQKISKATKKLNLFKKYNEAGFAIKGSWAIKLMYPDFPREPNDIDLIIMHENENFNDRFLVFKNKGYVSNIQEKFDFFQWEDGGEKIEVMLTISPFSTIVQKFGKQEIILEDPLYILGQKLIATLAFFYTNQMEEIGKNVADILFLLKKYSLQNITNAMVKHCIKNHFKLEQVKVIKYFVKNWKDQYFSAFDSKIAPSIIDFLKRVKYVARDNQLYKKINQATYFNYKKWAAKSSKL